MDHMSNREEKTTVTKETSPEEPGAEKVVVPS